MLRHEELKEYRQKQLDQKDKVENEMLEDGDRLSEILTTKEKLEFEREDLEAAEGEKDEGRILEIGDQLGELNMEIGSITQSLDDQAETLEFVMGKLNQVTEDIESFDIDSIAPMSFSALDSIESARATLKKTLRTSASIRTSG